MPSQTKAENPRLSPVLADWWRESVARAGVGPTLRCLARELWDFVLESTPGRRRRRYGDVEFDWNHRVDTTSATVAWRDRLLGTFLSAYQATEPAAFREMLDSLAIDFREFTFIDLGSGKGRTLLMASEYPFRRVVGVELLPALHRIAQENISKYKRETQKCFAIDSVNADARAFSFPAEPMVLYLFNPLPESGLMRVLDNLEISLREHPRAVYVLYHNPVLEEVLAGRATLRKIDQREQWCVYGSRLQ